MTRIGFLRNVLGAAAIMLMPKAALLVKKTQKATLLHCNVAGFQHYKGPHLLHNMQIGDLLQLHREKENKFDKRAIAVHYRGEKIGFIPGSENRMLSKLLDKDLLHISAEITAVNPDAMPWEAVYIAVFATKKV